MRGCESIVALKKELGYRDDSFIDGAMNWIRRNQGRGKRAGKSRGYPPCAKKRII
jgi:hypothetical protein